MYAEQAPATRIQPDAAHAVTLVQTTVGDAHHVQRFQCTSQSVVFVVMSLTLLAALPRVVRRTT